MEDPIGTPKTNPLGLGVAVTWLVLATFAAMGTLVAWLAAPETAVNAALITLPSFASGWCAVIAAWGTRTRPMPAPIVAPLAFGVAGFIAGVVAILVLYGAVWPGSW